MEVKVSQNNPEKDKFLWLQLVLAFVAAFALTLLYVLIDASGGSGVVARLGSSLIPNLIAALVIFVAIYLILVQKGIPTMRDVVEEVKSAARAGSNERAEATDVINFYPNLRTVPWPALLNDAHSLDIAVCYWDSWVKANWEPLVQFFARGGSMRVFLPDARVNDAVTVVCQRFSEHPTNTIKLKIINTGLRMDEALRASGSRAARLEVFFFPQSLNYSAIRFDSESVLLSVYEQFREERIDSSAILLNLTNSSHLAQYWDKEFGEFSSKSEKFAVDDLRTMAAAVKKST
jgi:hypothetical protein